MATWNLNLVVMSKWSDSQNRYPMQNIIGKISATCTHAYVIKKANFYVTDIVDTKVILGLQFCRAFNLVQINCDDQCVCKQIAVDIINSEFLRGLDPGNSHSTKSKS